MISKNINSLDIKKSLSKYKDFITKDINLVLRIADKQHTYDSELVHWEEEEITFFAPLIQRDWVIFDMDKIYELYFICNNNMFSTNIQFVSKFLDKEKLYYKAKIISPLTKKQQREHFRLSTLLNMSYQIIPENSSEFNSDAAPKYNASTINISVGGMCMMSDIILTKGTTLSIHLDFLNHPINLIATVLDTGNKTPSGTYIHRIKFINLNPVMENLLSKLIFEKQRRSLAPQKRPLK